MPKVKIQQIKIVTAIFNELVQQVPELKISQKQLAVITAAATDICKSLNVKEDN
ncbi:MULTISPECIES: hypothetical protein [Providencia]|uniref:hypothetical protein n=1 Tax=Providencia TaxID=586 RepID=UPI0003E2A1C0|nr:MULTISPECIES: hypothetical protein [Providencia]ETS98894.1 hypothetical protein HMPREF1568_3121 [Providencia alcalifaciens PAL-3]ETT05592.1 hypothetical protein HMPREF1562_1974 [Providencia alcalifaciens F90-2004]EUC99253.1 hypothetical protein HMPREF1566_0550 [Providencia alcalifaciens PAL-1]MTC21303.1 hypothetical protein [Providencia sp. wls1938]MTC22162.1 hypothetical protein [Providencia sp. wls1938]